MLRWWLAASAAVLCFAGSAILLCWAHEVYFVDFAGWQEEVDALKYLLGLDPLGGVLGMNVTSYIEDREGSIVDAVIAVALSTLLA